MENRNRLLPPVNTNTNCYNQPPDLVPKMANINQHLKKIYIIFFDKKKLSPSPSIPVTINENYLRKVKAKRVLGIKTEEYLTFTPHVEHITHKCKMAYNRLTLYPDLSPHLALQICKVFIRSKLEFDCTGICMGIQCSHYDI